MDACVTAQLSRAKPKRIEFNGMSLLPPDIDVSVFEDAASRMEATKMDWPWENLEVFSGTCAKKPMTSPRLFVEKNAESVEKAGHGLLLHGFRNKLQKERITQK